MANVSSFADFYRYEYDDVFMTTSQSNLTQWQLEQILNFSAEGKRCMTDFWSSPKLEGIFCFMNLLWLIALYIIQQVSDSAALRQAADPAKLLKLAVCRSGKFRLKIPGSEP